MEQLIDPDAILRNAKEQDARNARAEIVDPEKAWSRLSEVSLDPVILERHNLVTQRPSPRSAPFDQLRTRLIHQMQKSAHTKLAITSAHEGAGSSTLAANLALSLSRKSDLRVMLFDLDLRAPSLIHLFGLVEPGPRYSALRHHRRNFDSSCVRLGDTLALSLNATPIDEAAELLSDVKTTALIEHIERDFAPDLMIFDLPALTPMDDACAALAHVECALVVAQADRTTVKELDLAEQLVADRTTCLGVVLNQCRFADPSGIAAHA